jgi:hypothetical protein
MTESQLDTLTKINLDDLVSSFGWKDRAFLSRLVRLLFLHPAQTFASQVTEFDSAILTEGLPKAAGNMAKYYLHSLRVFGANHIPDGPVLALSNHPGLSDTLCAFAALNRRDLKIIAVERPFLNAMTNTSARHLYYVKDNLSERIPLIRQVTSHLRAGGAVLTFPAGHIEPDPDVYDGATESLNAWTESASIFIRLAPETAILPILVRGVVWDKIANHWLVRLRKTKEEREGFAAALQSLAYFAFNRQNVHGRVQIGKPIYAHELGSNQTQVLHQAVLTEMKYLIENPPEGEGKSILQSGQTHS